MNKINDERAQRPARTTVAAIGFNAACGVVVIGRNEGERLKRCLRSLPTSDAPLVYVDSGSTDASVLVAELSGATVVDLDLSLPFTAARARNAGFQRLCAISPKLALVFFVDGDCEVDSGWLVAASKFLHSHSGAAAVCGRLRERHPERSLYNRLCDLEWNAVVGEVRSCGGIVVMRISAFHAVGGFREDLIAGEEPELCVRLREAGWSIWRVTSEMAVHDAALTHFAQWWKRAKRGGHAFAEGAHLHGGPPERYGIREVRRALFWGLVAPAGLFMLAMFDVRWLWLALAYPAQVLRLTWKLRTNGKPDAARAFFMVLARFAEASGIVKFHWNRLLRRRTALIEYK